MSGAAVYRHFSATGELLYIGSSITPFHRMQNHIRESAWAREIATITISWFETDDEARAAEESAICLEGPLWNKSDTVNASFVRPLAKDRHLTLTAQKPWEALGMSRRTWYRRKKERFANERDG